MASRAEQILITIRTAGAAKARSDLDKVSRATEKLNKHIVDSGAAYELNTQAMKNNYDELQKRGDLLKGETKISRDYARTQEARVKTTRTETRGSRTSTKSVLEKVRAYAKLNAMIAEGNKNQKILINQNKEEAKTVRGVGYDLKGTWKVYQGLNKYKNRMAREETRRHNVAVREAKAEVVLAKKQEIAQNRLNRVIRTQRTRTLKSRFDLGQALMPKVTAQSLRVLAIVQGVLTLVPLLGTALNAVAAGALAAANGLAPILGMLGAIPPAIAALGQAGTVFLMAFGGNMAKALQGDAKAMAELGPQAQAMASAVASIKPLWRSVQNNVRENLFDGMGDELRRISQQYLPMMNNYLAETARRINKAGRNFGGWLQSGEGMQTNRRVARSSAYVAGKGAESGQLLLQTLLMVTAAAGPMVREISRDVLGLITRLNNWVAGNGATITSFFNGAYDRLKSVMSVIGDYGAGVYNIIKRADPLTKYIGEHIAQAGEDFRNWTGNNGNDITAYFESMKAPLGAVAHLAGEVAQGIFDISNNPKFIEVVNSLADKLVPAAVQLFKNLNVDMINGAIWLLSKAIDLYSGLPTWLTTGVMLGVLTMPIASYLFGIGRALAFLVINARNLKALGVGGMFKNMTGIGGAGMAAGGVAGAAGVGGVAAGTTLIPDGRGGFIAVPGGGGEGGARRSSGATAGKGAKPRRAAGKVRGGGKLGGLAGGALSTAGSLGIFALISAAAQSTNNGVSTTATNNSIDQFSKTGDTRSLAELWGIDTKNSRDFKNGWNPMTETLSGSLGKHWYSGIKNSTEGVFSSIFGGTTDQQKTLDNLGSIDTALAQMPADKAAKLFAKLTVNAKAAGVPMDKWVDAFPQYRDEILQTIPAQDRAGTSAQQLADKMSHSATKMDRIAMHYIDWLNNRPTDLTDFNANSQTSGAKKSGGAIRRSGGGGTISGGAWNGGYVPAGQTWVTGELGPEMTISRSGRIGMVGLGGPQLFSPTSGTAVIPSGATFNPTGGDFGNAPGWARDMLQGAPTDISQPSSASGGGSTSIEYKADINIQGNASASDAMSIRSEVYKAFKQLEQERKERR